MSTPEENRARMRKALEEKGWRPPVRDGRFDPVQLGRNLGAVAQDWGQSFAPVVRPFQDVARNAGAFFDNMAERDRRERALADEYMPLIRAANAGTQRSMDADQALKARSDQWARQADGDMRSLRNGYFSRWNRNEPIKPPHQMTNEELLAAIQAEQRQ